ncbi:laccase-1-like [Ischnura elegans]|uniref:laccase-1-like n=1 Tax=Ischnura elegans TaxID=197161 RepID=UPI001ED8BCA7|nr:laccase-1-like [Ischnura elegans]XP_046390565.1 laccase-1-like [Ischnura elegans]XP_046390566.1 laccase-1-like [Ischnura elegans]XP_046390567.1 laccase-1-like [Ischnura elegans]XP_046390568.1 laccase-1-like [Ischnura elegans]XP_046390569.1 laccase-1-like [Ischnura elegans]XP_046390570.1 laccase-1-like [Ischnura elegans]XP_046390571.1 laccase-1-like [Ischnura elegans]
MDNIVGKVFKIFIAVCIFFTASVRSLEVDVISSVLEDERVLELLSKEFHMEAGREMAARFQGRQEPQRSFKVGNCYRTCRLGRPPRICHYQFLLDSYVTMGDACGNCPTNRTACFDPQCITGDGYEKTVLTVNRKIPGPAIHVCRNDIIVVDVQNKMADRSSSIHWHGVLQKDTPHSDGVAQVTQCAIPPGTTFRYVFQATLAGTHFWHSHDGLQKMDGLVGNMVVRAPSEEDPNAGLSDTDFKEHVMLITDWLHDLTDARFPGVRRRLPPEQQRPDSLLFNGLGRYTDPASGMSTGTPLWTATVFVGVKHKFRVVNGGCLTCPISLTIERHRFRIVASDLHNVEPVTVDSIVILAGERYDFVPIPPDNVSDGDSFWIHAVVTQQCATTNNPPSQVAVLHYVTVDSFSSLTEEKEPITAVPPMGFMPANGVSLNSLGGVCRPNRTEICSSSLRFKPSAVGPKLPNYTLPPRQKPFRFVVPFGFHVFTNDELFRSGKHYRYFRPGIPLSSTINNMSMMLPSSPPLSQLDDIPDDEFCYPRHGRPHPLSRGGGGMTFKECFHVVNVPLNAVAEALIITDEPPLPIGHPFHLHGYDFQVLLQGLLGNNSAADIKKSFFEGTLQKRPDSPFPPLRDTVVLPPAGYAVIRFRADNPGFWLLHCHFAFHLASGMALVIQVGEKRDFVPPPPGFPPCGNYIPMLV